MLGPSKNLLRGGIIGVSFFAVGSTAFLATKTARMASSTSVGASFFDYTVKSAAGVDVPMAKYKDKKAILVVNVASE